MIDDFPLAEEDLPVPAPARARATHRTAWLAALLILAAAIAVRVWPSAGFTGVGFDEALYRNYVVQLDTVGLTGFPEICQLYLEDQRRPETMTKLPPTRFLYVFTAWLWKRAEFGSAAPAQPRTPGFAEKDPALVSLHRVSCAFSILGVIAAGLAAWRMFGIKSMPGVLALTGFAPVSIHMAQHALIDGYFAFWATMCLWLLWENLRHPRDARWLAALGACVAAMVLTKENSFFVFVALAGLVVANRWAKFGTVTPGLIVAGTAGAFAATLVLVSLAGGISHFVEIYRLLVTKAETLTYAIKTGDGPWHRYLVDMLIVSPLVLVLAIGGFFTQLKKSRAFVFLALFVGLTYAFMCNVKYAMNLRYATIWDLPLCALAVAQIGDMTKIFGRRQALA
ncbi:MAG TPA: hypothetical protein VEO95_12975, partial [Chthoniobacteraceae bacterium]|nr:hypothetical protein [Chthoniobacteraceae bacterium]